MVRIQKVGNVMGGILVMLLCMLPPIEIEAQEPAEATGIFVVTGTITRDNAPVETGLQVTVRNRTTGVVLSDRTGESAGAGGYVVTFSDLRDNRAAAIGDQIEVSVFDREGNMLDQTNQSVTVDEITANLLRIDIALAEKVPPRISAVSASWITSTFVLITWTTDEPGSSIVEYGATTAYGLSATGEDNVTSHSVTLTDLSPSTTYHYRVGSTDESGNAAWSEDQPFTTSMARGSAQTTGIFVVTGTITRDGFPVNERLDVRVRNRITGAEHADRTGRTAGVGEYVVTFSDLGDNRAAAVGDEIVVSAVDREGNVLGTTSHTVASDEIAVSLTRIDVPLGIEQTLPGDFNGDAWVNLIDFSLFAQNYDLSIGDPGFDPLYDLDGDERIGLGDFSIFAGNYGLHIGAAKRVSMRTGRNTEASLSADMSMETSSEGGRSVHLNVGIQGARDLEGYAFKIRYDPKQLVFLKADRNAQTLPGNDPSRLPLLEMVSEPGELLIADVAVGDEAIRGNGRLADLIFSVEEGSKDLCFRIEMELLDAEGGIHALWTKQVNLLPEQFALHQNFPNPFNAETIIRYQLPAASAVRMTVYNLLGQEVRRLVDGNVEAGIHWMGWDGRDGAGKALASGIYFCRLQVEDFVQTRSMVILQ